MKSKKNNIEITEQEILKPAEVIEPEKQPEPEPEPPKQKKVLSVSQLEALAKARIKAQERKKVLAELHQLINSLEDHGLTAEASSLQEVFVRVAQEADPNDLSEKVTDLLGKYSAPELIAALAEQMDSKDTKTMSFAFGDEPAGYGNEPKDVIINEFVDQAKNRDMRQDDAYFMMNQRLQFNGHPTLTKK